MSEPAQDDAFALELLGGWLEQRYRTGRPDLDALPWGTLDVSAFDEAQLLGARSGWTDLAVQERLAAVSSARVHWLVQRCEAPLDLCSVVGEVARDECAHAELCARVLAELGGPVEMRFDRARTLGLHGSTSEQRFRDAAVAVAAELCAGETVNLRPLAFRRSQMTEPLLRDVWTTIGRDEAMHSAVGFAFVKWVTPMLSDADLDAMRAAARKVVAMVERREAEIAALPAAWFTPVGVFGTADRDEFLAESACGRAETMERIAAWVR